MRQFKNLRLKKMVIMVFMTLFLAPFILISDFFPFSRFGMFAEPIKRKIQSETFLVRYIDSNNNPKTWNFKSVGLYTSPEYLIRNYYYKKESVLFLKKINSISKDETIKEWQLIKLSSPSQTINDSLIVARYQP